MMESSRSERLEMRWLPVVDATGHLRMEASWVPVATAAAPEQPMATHAA